MMTDAMKPLGLSFWQLTTPRPMAEAGGRLFVDVTQGLASPASRAGLLELLGKSDPLIGDALQTIVERDGFIRSLPDEGPGGCQPAARQLRSRPIRPLSPSSSSTTQASIVALKRDIQPLVRIGFRCQ